MTLSAAAALPQRPARFPSPLRIRLRSRLLRCVPPKRTRSACCSSACWRSASALVCRCAAATHFPPKHKHTIISARYCTKALAVLPAAPFFFMVKSSHRRWFFVGARHAVPGANACLHGADCRQRRCFTNHELPSRCRIINPAGEPGDRRFASRKGSGREESPDSSRGGLARAGLDRATRLVTPGRRVLRRAKVRGSGMPTESATENIPPVTFLPRRQAFGKTASLPVSARRIGKGEKVG